MESPEKVISPVRPRERQHGGRRSGAGRKKKPTPVKKIRKSELAFNRQRGPKGSIRKKWLKAQNDLVTYIRSNAELGEEYKKIYNEYVNFGNPLDKLACALSFRTCKMILNQLTRRQTMVAETPVHLKTQPVTSRYDIYYK